MDHMRGTGFKSDRLERRPVFRRHDQPTSAVPINTGIAADDLRASETRAISLNFASAAGARRAARESFSPAACRRQRSARNRTPSVELPGGSEIQIHCGVQRMLLVSDRLEAIDRPRGAIVLEGEIDALRDVVADVDVRAEDERRRRRRAAQRFLRAWD